MPNKRPRGPQLSWKPKRETERVLVAVEAMLDLYADYLPVTLRQIFYVIQGQGVLAKTQRDYKRMCEYVGMARRSGRIPWSSIRDDRQIAAEAPPAFAGPEHYWRVVHDIALDYRTDRQYGQPTRLELWSETEGMVPQLARLGEQFGISTYSGSGFDGLNGKHEAAERAIAGGIKTCILHVGDHDPSGEWLLTALAEDVTAFAEAAGAEVEFVQIAVTPEQIERYHLPTALPKPTDRRSYSDTTTTQAESLLPDVLAAIVREEIEARRDMDLLREVIEREPAERQAIIDRLNDLR
ncbi:hypothetical protein ACFWXO_16715 [Kitasatospora sp. NPDC059088]|uniref:hypothetical protein n=1 Tax=Kitasatospora sp. NPDC059088 TaxID=3346722 RepID=UPI0036823CAD